MRVHCLSECGANELANHWTRKCSVSASARRRLTERAKSRHRSHHASRFAALVRNAVHRIWRGYSDGLALAWTQRRRRVGNENLRPLATRAQHRPSAAGDFHANRDKASRCHSVSRESIDGIVESRTLGNFTPVLAGRGGRFGVIALLCDPLGQPKKFLEKRDDQQRKAGFRNLAGRRLNAQLAIRQHLSSKSAIKFVTIWLASLRDDPAKVGTNYGGIATAFLRVRSMSNGRKKSLVELLLDMYQNDSSLHEFIIEWDKRIRDYTFACIEGQQFPLQIRGCVIGDDLLVFLPMNT